MLNFGQIDKAISHNRVLPTPGNAERFARKHGTPAFLADYRQLLAEPDMEMVTSDLRRPGR